tara:strand:- start:46781 stop:47245 length:465 start_codon:yes stop_codon:yes gene_type:complete
LIYYEVHIVIIPSPKIQEKAPFIDWYLFNNLFTAWVYQSFPDFQDTEEVLDIYVDYLNDTSQYGGEDRIQIGNPQKYREYWSVTYVFTNIAHEFTHYVQHKLYGKCFCTMVSENAKEYYSLSTEIEARKSERSIMRFVRFYKKLVKAAPIIQRH